MSNLAECNLLVIVYGSCARDPNNDDRFTGHDQRRAEISLRPKLPASAMASMAAKHRFMQQYLLNIALDCKHSRNWRCEFCKKHARETVWMTASWMHLSPPRMVCYVHNICDSAHGECHEKLAALNEEMGRATGCPPNALPQSAVPAGRTEYPLSASCANCERDETATQRNTLKQCTRCKVTRYCRYLFAESHWKLINTLPFSAECQRPDWPRHKDFCKAVEDVKWIWN